MLPRFILSNFEYVLQKMAPLPSLAVIPYVGEESALSIPELSPKDLQDNILATVGDAS